MKFTYNNQTYTLILFTLSGSRFYGTYFDGVDSVDENGMSREHPFNPTYISDYDWRGIFIAHPDTKIGLTGTIEQIEVKKDKHGKIGEVQQALIKELNSKLKMNMAMDEDLTLYEIKKFINLSLDNNPNIMDMLYATESSIRYINEQGNELLKNKDIFLSTKTKFTFSGYAMSQLSRLKGHNKMIVKYPKINSIIQKLKDAYNATDIDFNWISDQFGGHAASFITKLSQLDANNIGKLPSIEWEKFIDQYSDSTEEDFYKKMQEYSIDEAELKSLEDTTIFPTDWDNYRRPQLINYCHPKSLKAQTIDMDTPVTVNGQKLIYNNNEVLMLQFLNDYAAFRTISQTQYNIFTPSKNVNAGGLFTRNGDLKSNDTEEVGEFVCQLTIDNLNYKKDIDTIVKLWEWRTKRNEKRSILEEKFGYDTKHASHLFRLLIGAKNILTTGDYKPVLSGDNLTLVLDVLNGKYSYDWIITESKKLEENLNILYKKSELSSKPNHKKAENLLIKLSKSVDNIK